MVLKLNGQIKRHPFQCIYDLKISKNAPAGLGFCHKMMFCPSVSERGDYATFIIQVNRWLGSPVMSLSHASVVGFSAQ